MCRENEGRRPERLPSTGAGVALGRVSPSLVEKFVESDLVSSP